MALTDVINRIMEDFNQLKNSPETLKILKKKLKKAGYTYQMYDAAMGEVSLVGHYKFLKVWDAIDRCLNKKGFRWGNKSGEDKLQTIRVIRQLCEIDNIEEVIETLGEIGYDIFSYHLREIRTYVSIPEESLDQIKTIAKDDLYKGYLSVFKALQKLGYKGLNGCEAPSSTQLDHLGEIAALEEEPAGAIYVLASNGYEIDPRAGISKLEIQNIKRIIEGTKEESLDQKSVIPIYLYDKGNLEIFQDYFENLEDEDKKSVIKSILDHRIKEESSDPESEEQIQRWLEENYQDMLREVGFS